MIEEIGSEISIIVIQREAKLIGVRAPQWLEESTFGYRLVREFKGFAIIEGRERVVVGTDGRGWAAEGVGEEALGVHEVMGVEGAGNEAIAAFGVGVLEWEKSLPRAVDQGFEG